MNINIIVFAANKLKKLENVSASYYTGKQAHIFKFVQLLLGLFLLLCCKISFAAGQQMINAIMRSDFIFDRNISNVPFFPIAWLSVSQQPDMTFDECIETYCDFENTSFSQGFGLPISISKKDMWIIGETLYVDKYTLNNQTYKITTIGGVLAWVSQPTPKWQLGAGIYAYQGIDMPESLKKDLQSIAAVVGRYRNKPNFHTYYGLIRWKNFSEARYYPYIGMDWYPNKQWAVSMVFPWPTLSYAPDTHSIYRFGAIDSGNSFQLKTNQELLSSGFSQWHLGLSVEKRIENNIWGSLTIGTSILDGMYIDESGDTTIELGIKRSPFIKLSFNYRPG